MSATAPVPDLARPGWTRTTSLFQLRLFAFWLFLGLLALGALATVGIQSAFHRISPAGWALSWGLLALYAAPVFAAIYLLDLYEREPPSLVIGALLWGALVAPLLAGIGNDGWGLVIARLGGPAFAARWTAALTAPWVEEIVKAAGVAFLYLIAREEFDDELDGFVYGAMVGLGFTVVEDVFYFMGVFGGHPAGVLAGFWLRVVSSGLYGHVLYTGLAGMGIASFVSRRGGVPFLRRLGTAAGLFGLAMFGHFLWNSPLLDFFPKPPWSLVDWAILPLATAVKGLPLLGFVGLLVVMARRREGRWLSAALQAEVARGAVRADEVETLLSPRARRRAVKEMRRRAGSRAAGILRRLQRQQIGLAMVRTRAGFDDDPDLVRQRAYCGSLRDALATIPGAAPAVPSP